MNNQHITPQARKEIIDWFSSHRPWDDGVALYRRYGYNRMLHRYFRAPESAQGREMLIEELRKLAGLSHRQLSTLPRLARRSDLTLGPPEPIDTPKAPQEQQPDGRTPAGEAVARIQRLRERYPFLNDRDCPDVLKVLVADLITAYHSYTGSHSALTAMPDDRADADTEQLARDTVESYLRHREIREELDYYRDHGQILGKAAAIREIETAEETASLSDLDLARKLHSAKVQLNKCRKKLEKGDETARAKVENWEEQVRLYQLETEARKKKLETSATD